MRVLVLSGEVTHTRPMSYGFPPDWDLQVVSLIDPEYLVLCEKYGSVRDVPPAETITFLRRAYDQALTHIEQVKKLDVVIGTGYGAQVLMNLSTACEWIGPAVYVLSEGITRYNFVSRPLSDEIDHTVPRGETAWVSMVGSNERNRKAGRTSHTRKCVHEKSSAIQLNLPRADWAEHLYAYGLLRTCVDAVCRSSTPQTHRSKSHV